MNRVERRMDDHPYAEPWPPLTELEHEQAMAAKLRREIVRLHRARAKNLAARLLLLSHWKDARTQLGYRGINVEREERWRDWCVDTSYAIELMLSAEQEEETE